MPRPRVHVNRAIPPGGLFLRAERRGTRGNEVEESNDTSRVALKSYKALPFTLGGGGLAVALCGSLHAGNAGGEVLRSHGRTDRYLRIEGKEPRLGDGREL